jgi:hypothetical protein
MGRTVRFVGRPAVVGVSVRGRIAASKIDDLAIRRYLGLRRLVLVLMLLLLLVLGIWRAWIGRLRSWTVIVYISSRYLGNRRRWRDRSLLLWGRCVGWNALLADSLAWSGLLRFRLFWIQQ